MTIFGACAIICGIVSLWLPETALRPLYQTTMEAEEGPEDYGIPFLKKRKSMEARDDETNCEWNCILEQRSVHIIPKQWMYSRKRPYGLRDAILRRKMNGLGKRIQRCIQHSFEFVERCWLGSWIMLNAGPWQTGFTNAFDNVSQELSLSGLI